MPPIVATEPAPITPAAPPTPHQYGSRAELRTQAVQSLVLRKCSKNQAELPDQVRIHFEGQSDSAWKATHAALAEAVAKACVMLREWPRAGAVCVDMTSSGSFVARYAIYPQQGIIVRRILL